MATSAIAEPAEEPAFGALTGNVSSTVSPLALTKVYAYHLSGEDLRKVSTDRNGNFQFERLPAGLYKIIAFKDGFVPGIALLSRSTSEAFQYLSLELSEDEPEVVGEEDGFWAVREKIPGDVLRDIEVEMAALEQHPAPGAQSNLVNRDQIEAEMAAIAGVDQTMELGNASMAGARVDVEGEISAVNVGVQGNYVTLQPVPGASSSEDLSSTGRSQNVSLQVLTKGSSGVRVSSTNNYRSTIDPALEDDFSVGLARHRVSWTQNLGRHGRSDLSVDYAEESNFFNQTAIAPFWIPDASRTWRVEGSYSTAINKTSNIRTGFRFRERQFAIDGRSTTLDYDPMQRVDVFGNSGMQVKPGILVEFGLYSTLADGSLALAPSGGVAVKLGQRWRAEAAGSWRAHEDDRDTLYEDFTPAMYGEYQSCQALEEYCYKITLAHQGQNEDDLTLGVVNRRFAETLHLYFNDDFFSRVESVYLVRGDQLPEVQFAASRRLSPRILARLSSNIAAGGGGILYATDDNSYENEVRYLVTSLDTRFQQTETGVFMAFHHVGQKLTPMGQTVKRVPEMELERLQLMLTQDLGILSQVASAWAVHLNMEVSRGTSPEDPDAAALYDDEELRKRVMGGVSVSF